MEKRGQVALWILVAILILIIFAFYVGTKGEPRQIEKSAEINSAQINAQQFLASCLEDRLSTGVLLLGLQTGRLSYQGEVYDSLGVKIPYSLGFESTPVPSIDISAKELEEYLTKEVGSCTNQYHDVAPSGFQIQPGEISAHAQIGKTITATITDTTTFYNEKQHFSLSGASAEVKIPYDQVYKFLQTIDEIHRQTPDSIPISGVAHAAYNASVTYTYFDIGTDGLLYEFQFPFKIKEIPYRLDYLVRMTQ